MIVVLRYLGTPSHEVVAELSLLGFNVSESHVIMIWDDWVLNRESSGLGKKKKIRYSGDMTRRSNNGTNDMLDGF
jgi:hypothetical protein